jgi:hypothetical protein
MDKEQPENVHQVHGAGKRHTLRQLATSREDWSESFERVNWADAQQRLPERGTIWSNYLLQVDLYKYYLDVIWKVSVWYYGVSGALLAYFFGHLHENNPFLPWSLVPLIAGSWLLSLLHLRGVTQLLELRDWMEYAARSLRLPGRPHVEMAATFIVANGILLALAGAGLLVIMVAALI